MKRTLISVLLLLNGIINLFPKTFDERFNLGYEPVNLRTIIGLLTTVLAIALLSFYNNFDQKKEVNKE